MGDYGANIPQAGDVLHTMDTNGGVTTEDGGYLVMTTGIESAILDCLMGGNRDDDGSRATEKLQWCGNEGEKDEYRSRGRFLSMCNGQPITSARLPEFEEAARDDIVKGMPRSVVTDAKVTVSMTGPKRLDITINVTMTDDTVYTVTQGVDV